MRVLFYMLVGLFLAGCTGEKNLNQEKIEASPNFRDGTFHNLEPDTRVEFSFTQRVAIMWDIFVVGRTPNHQIPAKKENILDMSDESMVWFGHSSYMLKTAGKTLLVDPLLNESASPLPFTNRVFDLENFYTPKDFPYIDVLFITHNHYDHMSASTLKALKDKVGLVIVPLGVGKYLKGWGYANIIELDWDEVYEYENLKIHALTSRHYSSRSFSDKNTSLWASFMVQTPTKNIYFGGDGGYGKHFKTIGEKFGKVDIAFLDNGQYNPRWREIHMLPQDVLSAADDMSVEFLVPVHNSKYSLALHEWNTPLKEITALHVSYPYIKLMTPLIGEVVPLWNDKLEFKRWWD